MMMHALRLYIKDPTVLWKEDKKGFVCKVQQEQMGIKKDEENERKTVKWLKCIIHYS